MIAIETKYLGASNFRGSRIVATTANGQRHVQQYDDGVNSDVNHQSAADHLALRMDWFQNGRFRLVGGGTKSGMCFVFVENPQ